MPRPEQLELEAHREQLEIDVRRLVEKYLAIANWDVPEIDWPLAIRLIIAAVGQALDHVEKALPGPQGHELLDRQRTGPRGPRQVPDRDGRERGNLQPSPS